MTDKKCNEKGWNHAYVMMLDSLKGKDDRREV